MFQTSVKYVANDLYFVDLYLSYIPCVLCVYQKQMFLKLQYWLIVTQYHSIPVAWFHIGKIFA